MTGYNLFIYFPKMERCDFQYTPVVLVFAKNQNKTKNKMANSTPRSILLSVLGAIIFQGVLGLSG